MLILFHVRMLRGSAAVVAALRRSVAKVTERRTDASGPPAVPLRWLPITALCDAYSNSAQVKPDGVQQYELMQSAGITTLLSQCQSHYQQLAQHQAALAVSNMDPAALAFTVAARNKLRTRVIYSVQQLLRQIALIEGKKGCFVVQ